MSESPPVVVGVDGSRTAELALLWAAQEAERRLTGLVIAHAGDTGGSSESDGAAFRDPSDSPVLIG